MTKTYTVHIETIEHYTINVEAESFADAEEKSWRLFPHHSPDHIENNVTEITCAEDTP
jgi:hypothetical protein